MILLQIAMHPIMCSSKVALQSVLSFVFFVMQNLDNDNNVHLSCAHQRLERSHDTY